MTIGGQVATKPATASTRRPRWSSLAETGPSYASRGGHKLAGALDAFGYDPAGVSGAGRRRKHRWVHRRPATRGATHVVAVDVGYGQLAWSLQSDERVTVLDRTNVRTLTPEQIGGPVDLVVADLSFIPLHLVLPALIGCCATGADLHPDGQTAVRGGPRAIAQRRCRSRPCVARGDGAAVAARQQASGWGVRDVTASPLPGPNGNVEFFLWLRADAPPLRGRRAATRGSRGAGVTPRMRGWTA